MLAWRAEEASKIIEMYKCLCNVTSVAGGHEGASRAAEAPDARLPACRPHSDAGLERGRGGQDHRDVQDIRAQASRHDYGASRVRSSC